MPLPIFAALKTGITVIAKSPIFKNALTAGATAAGNAAQGRATTVSSSGSTLRIAPDATVLGSNNNLLLLIGVGIVALFFIMKK
jgi:hypothetical protein